jgi:alkylation response protein AidB-like acyl-CoA dehydrogenase
MNFEVTSEQALLKDNVARFVRENYGLDARRKLADGEPGWSEAHWKTMADLGWLALPFSEADGGLGGTAIDTMLLMEELGKGLVLEPYLASIVLGGGALRRGGDAALKASLLPTVIDGTMRLAFAYAEEQARFDLDDVVTRAQRDGDGFVLNGRKSLVLHGQSAHHVVVTARTSGGQQDQSGITLFLIDAKATGVGIEGYSTVDGQRAAELTLTNVHVARNRVLGVVDRGWEILEAVAIDGILAICAEAVGAMEVLYKDTVEYTQQRVQFDHPLADFQVLQHRMVDMFVEYEQCKSLLYRATMEVAAGAPDAARTVHALKHLVGRASTFVGENAVQLHGGMGVTEELRIGHYFKRLLAIDMQFGNADHHLVKFAA